MHYNINSVKIIKNNAVFLLLVFSSILVTYTYYFDHYALGNALIQNNDKLYEDKTNLFYLINKNSPSFLFISISFLIKLGFSSHFINVLLTFIPTLLNLSGIYLICDSLHLQSYHIVIALTVILLKNFGDIDYPTLMFTEHTNGLFAYSLSTFILGLLTIKIYHLHLYLSIIIVYTFSY